MAVIGTITYELDNDEMCVYPVPDFPDEVYPDKLYASKAGSGVRDIALRNETITIVHLTFEIDEDSRDAFVGDPDSFSVQPNQPVYLRLKRHILRGKKSRVLSWHLISSSHDVGMCAHKRTDIHGNEVFNFHTEAEVEC